MPDNKIPYRHKRGKVTDHCPSVISSSEILESIFAASHNPQALCVTRTCPSQELVAKEDPMHDGILLGYDISCLELPPSPRLVQISQHVLAHQHHQSKQERTLLSYRALYIHHPSWQFEVAHQCDP